MIPQTLFDTIVGLLKDNEIVLESMNDSCEIAPIDYRGPKSVIDVGSSGCVFEWPYKNDKSVDVADITDISIDQVTGVITFTNSKLSERELFRIYRKRNLIIKQ